MGVVRVRITGRSIALTVERFNYFENLGRILLGHSKIFHG